MSYEIKIANKYVGLNHSPFIIAEMSGNHNKSFERAKKLIESAATTGAHAIKFQTYTAETMTLNISDGDFLISDAKSLWHGRNLYDLYDEAHTPWEWHEELFNHAKELGMIPFSSPFDKTSVDFLESLDVPCYKVASFECTDLPLVSYIASKGKPMIISTGMASVAEIGETVKTAKDNGCNDIILLKCTSTYPASPKNTNILTIPHLRELFECEVGLSDHTMGIGTSVASVALGATVIEKHFTSKRSDGGVDSSFSMEPHELESLVVETERAHQSLGKIKYGPLNDEAKSLVFRRSIYITKDIKAGEILSHENIRVIRPGYGLEPKFLDLVIGRPIRKDVKMGTALTWDII